MRYLYMFVLAATLWAAAATSEAQTLPATPVPYASSMESAQKKPDAPFTVYTQTDPRWKDVRFGGKTVREHGCAIFSLVQAFFMSGSPIDPLDLLELLDRERLLTRSGDLRWDFPPTLPVAFVMRKSLTQATAVADVERQLSQGMLVMLKLDHSASGKRGEHWVFVYKTAVDDLIVGDPVHGYGSLRDFYGRLGVSAMVVLVPQ